MTTYVEVAQALVTAGYLSDADIQAAADILEDALIVLAAEDMQDAAAGDYAIQEDIVAEAEVWANEDATVGDYESVAIDDEIIEEAAEQMEADRAIMAAGELVIDAAYTDAAAALLAAELIDEANRDAVAAVIADVWVVEEE
jgi:hypothetical protein